MVAFKVPGALLCYPVKRLHLVRYLNDSIRIYSHSPITIFLLSCQTDQLNEDVVEQPLSCSNIRWEY